VCSFYFFESHIHWPISNFFGNMEHPAIEAPLRTPSCKIKINVHPWIIVYIEGSWSSGKAYGIKPSCYWEHVGTFLRTWREQIGKKGVKNKKILPTQPPKGKKKNPSWGHAKPSHGLQEISLSKLFVTIVCLAFLPLVELILLKFPVVSLYICLFGLLFFFNYKGAWETTHSQPPNPQSLLLQPR